eukprot:15358563-Alexandrium_andersonii.AAC.1
MNRAPPTCEPSGCAHLLPFLSSPAVPAWSEPELKLAGCGGLSALSAVAASAWASPRPPGPSEPSALFFLVCESPSSPALALPLVELAEALRQGLGRSRGFPSCPGPSGSIGFTFGRGRLNSTQSSRAPSSSKLFARDISTFKPS